MRRVGQDVGECIFATTSVSWCLMPHSSNEREPCVRYPFVFCVPFISLFLLSSPSSPFPSSLPFFLPAYSSLSFFCSFCFAPLYISGLLNVNSRGYQGKRCSSSQNPEKFLVFPSCCPQVKVQISSCAYAPSTAMFFFCRHKCHSRVRYRR